MYSVLINRDAQKYVDRIYEEEKAAKVLNIMTIEEAHKKYGMF